MIPIEKETAIEIYDLALKAVESLSKVLYIDQDYQEYDEIKKGVGLSIGRIQMEILEVINDKYPELDHLKDRQ